MHRKNVGPHKATCKLLHKPRAMYASEISEILNHQILGSSSIATSEKDRQNDLAQNESVFDESFELEQSFEPFTMP